MATFVNKVFKIRLSEICPKFEIMSQSVLFLALFLLCIQGEPFELHKEGWNYCTQTCTIRKVKYRASGCYCTQRGSRKEIFLEEFRQFREFMVNEHNRLRNLLASGNETRGYAKAAANMLVINYDLELEYLARCYARCLFNGKHDKCRNLQNGQLAGQNIDGTAEPPAKGMSQPETSIGNWYKEIEYMEEWIYLRFKDAGIGHFTGMVWWSIDSVGCARVHVANPKEEKFEDITVKTYMICNYAGKKLKLNSNVIKQPVYLQGPPCSKCPDHEKLKNCNTIYTSLCGELEPIPIDRPFYLGEAQIKICGKITTLALAFAVLMVL